jgi:hypothetical protein
VKKAILLVGFDGVAMMPAILCADNSDEARQGNIPLFDEVFACLSCGKEIRPNGDSDYELFEKGQRVGLLEIFESPRFDGGEKAER